jgi:hypothetical protein
LLVKCLVDLKITLLKKYLHFLELKISLMLQQDTQLKITICR